MKPGEHCRNSTNKAMGVFKQITKFSTKKIRTHFLKLYKRYISSYLEFVSPAWSPRQTGDIDTIKKVQEKALRITSTRRKKQDITQVFKILKVIDKIDPEELFPALRTTQRQDNFLTHGKWPKTGERKALAELLMSGIDYRMRQKTLTDCGCSKRK